MVYNYSLNIVVMFVESFDGLYINLLVQQQTQGIVNLPYHTMHLA